MQGEAIDLTGMPVRRRFNDFPHTNRQAYAKTQNQAYSGQLSASFEPMTFSNTPFPTGDKGSARNRGCMMHTDVHDGGMLFVVAVVLDIA